MKYRAANPVEDFSVRAAAESGQRENIKLAESHPPKEHFKKLKGFCHEKIFVKVFKIY